jgi:plastocyanin
VIRAAARDAPGGVKPIALLAAAVACLAGCGSSDSEPPTAAAPASASATVDIASFKYAPATVTVKKGGRVRWTNSDGAAHTSTADDRSFDTQTIDRGKARMVTFTTAGTFAYHCDFHPFMKGEVVVR